MKFISKNPNLMIILQPGIPAQPMLGTPPKPALYVQFKGGIVEVSQEEIITMLLAHPGYQIDYIPADEEDAKRFNKRHVAPEPQHILTKMEGGRPSGQIGGDKKPGVTPEMMEMLKGIAKEMAMEIAPTIAKDMALKMVQEMTSAKEPAPLQEDTTINPLAELESLEDSPVGKRILSEPGSIIDEVAKRKVKTK